MGQVYCALLVFVTQILSMQRSIQVDQTLTATHDNAAAWAGIGSATALLWNQKAVPASFISVLAVLLYLGNILVLHVTILGLFPLETSNSTRFVPVITHGLPTFNFSGYDLSIPLDRDDAWWVKCCRNVPSHYFSPDRQDTMDYARRTLYFLPSILESTTTLGVRDGTLYDVPERNVGTGNVTVNATGFNITCRYVTDMSFILIPAEGRWEMKSGDGRTLGWIERTRNGYTQWKAHR